MSFDGEKNVTKKENINAENNKLDNIARQRLKEIRRRRNLSQEQILENKAPELTIDRLKNMEQGRTPINIERAIEIARAFNVSLDFIYGLTDNMDEEEITITKAFESLFNPQLIHKEYIDIEGKIYNVDFLSLTANDLLIQYFYSLKKCEEIKKEITEEEYKYRIEDIKNKYYEGMKQKVDIKTQHYLIPSEFAEKRFLYDLKEIK